jgi:hypothetical protein
MHVISDRWGRFRSIAIVSGDTPEVGAGDDGFLWIDVGVDGSVTLPVLKVYDEQSEAWVVMVSAGFIDHAHDGEVQSGGQLDPTEALTSESVAEGYALLADGAGNVVWDEVAGGSLALDDLTDVNAGLPNDEDVLTWDETAGEWIAAAGGGGGASTFVGLTDTPANYTGQAGKYVVVNATGDGLFFADAPLGWGLLEMAHGLTLTTIPVP